MKLLPLLPTASVRPTLRDIAALVREGGSTALTEAERRADAARYQEIRCRSALNRVEGMPFRWTLNPYRGCTHGCHYCFARRYQAHVELGAGDDFATVILVKVNLVDVLRRELDRPSWTRELVAVGTATDPYQPIEGRYHLTRGALEALARASTPVGLVTKGPMVVRDIDLLQDVAARAGCTVYVSVPSVDEDAWRSLEPGTAHPLQRLRAVRTLADAGVRVGVLMAPVVPGITAHRPMLERTVHAIAESGAAFAGVNVLYLEGGTRAHFLDFLAREHPGLVETFGDLYRGGAKYAPPAYVAEVKAFVATLQARAGLGSREPAPPVKPPPDGTRRADLPRQRAFSWTN